MSLMNKRLVSYCEACGVVLPSPGSGGRVGRKCRRCFDKPFIEGRARAAEHNARLKAEEDRKREKERIRYENRPKETPVSNEAAMVITFVAGVYLSYEGYEIGNFFLLGSGHVRRLEKQIKELKRKL
jgi:hypothetical protein